MERIIVEQLRDRLYYATDTIVTYIDSRVLICNSNEFPQSLEDKAKFITTSKYYILESGDLCPCNDLYYKEDIRLLSRISFERKEGIRKFTNNRARKPIPEGMGFLARLFVMGWVEERRKDIKK